MMRQTNLAFFLAVVVSVCLFNSGCGGSSDATVFGTVEIDGKSIPEGRVVFSSGTSICASQIVNGRYQLKNKGKPKIPLSEYTITVFPPANTVVLNPSTGEEEPVKSKADPALFPKKYQKVGSSDIKFSPAAGDNEFNIVLQKK